jgi:class 3 adenylate cyclase
MVGIRWHEAPFRGLLPFEYKHAPVFFGRSRARNELRELLARQDERGRGFVLVLGASGSGKSSLVYAGLLPDLMLPGWIGRVALCRYAFLRPSDQPDDLLRGLAEATLSATALPELSGLRYTIERLTALLRKAPDQGALVIEQGLAEAGRAATLSDIAEARLVLVIDQLEELFTQREVTDRSRDEFVGTLAALVGTGLVWIIATLRSDFFDRLETLPSLARLADGEARYLLLPPDDAELSQIVQQPAREAGVSFESDARDGISLDVSIRDAARDRRVLPLLSFLLEQLWLRRTEEGKLTFKAYRELGGLEGALSQRANEVFTAQPPEVQEALPAVLRALVAINPNDRGSVTARPGSLGKFPEGTPERRLIEAFCAPSARLLVTGTGEGAGGQPWVRVAHEALLTHWETARRQIADDLADLELASLLSLEADRWNSAPAANRDRLLRAGSELTRAEDLFVRRRGELDAHVVKYLEAALAREATARERTKHDHARRSGAVAIAIAVLALLYSAVFTDLPDRLSRLSFDFYPMLSTREPSSLSVEVLQPPKAMIAGIGVASVVGIALILVLPRIGLFLTGVLGAAAVMTAVGVSWFCFSKFGLLIDPVYPIMTLSAFYLVGALFGLLTPQRRPRQREILNVLSHFISPHYARELVAHPKMLTHGGQTRPMTIMFCDIRGFTAVSQYLDAETLFHFLNSFLSPMTEIITEHNGTIDKYIGGSIMAFWNAPLDDPDHANNAVLAAQAMRRKLIELNRGWQAEARYELFLPVRISISINSGECVVGNFGSQHQHFDYTVMGDSVNLASRLGTFCALYDIDLVIGEKTAARLDDPALIDVDFVAVRGATPPCHLYTLAPKQIEGEEFIGQHSALLRAYRRQDWAMALHLLDDGRLKASTYLAGVYDVYRRRIARFQIEGPPANWDGVFDGNEW